METSGRIVVMSGARKPQDQTYWLKTDNSVGKSPKHDVDRKPSSG
jgi:hypothetical protein